MMRLNKIKTKQNDTLKEIGSVLSNIIIWRKNIDEKEIKIHTWINIHKKYNMEKNQTK